MKDIIKYILVFCILISSVMLCSCDGSGEFFSFMLEACFDACAETCAEACSDEITVSCVGNMDEKHLTEYVFIHSTENWNDVKIELVDAGYNWSIVDVRQYETVAVITDNEAFIEEFGNLKCWNTTSYENDYEFIYGTYGKLIRIVYPDSQSEIISVSESSLCSDEAGVNPIAFGYMVFDKQDYNKFWDKWALECAVQEP